MAIVFSDITAKISDFKIIRTVNEQQRTIFHRAQLLTEQLKNADSGTIYVGEASRVNPGLDQRDDIGLLLINNCGFDFSKLKGTAAELPSGTDLFQLINTVLDVMNDKRSIADRSAALLACLVDEKGLNDIIKIGAEIIGNPITLSDYSGKTLASSDQLEKNNPAWMDLAQGYPKQEIYSIFRTNKYTKIVNESPTPVFLDINHPKIPRMVIGKITIKNKIVGHLSVLENDQPISEVDIELVKVLIDVITTTIQKNNYYLSMAGIHHEVFILDLIQEKHDNPTTIEDRVRSLQWDAYHDFHIVIINIPKKNEVVFFVEYLRTRLGYIFPFSKSIYYEENVILVIYKDRDIQEITKKLTAILVENNLNAGVSQRFSSIIDLKRHYEQAIQALNLGKLLKKDGIFLYEELYLYDLLTIINRHSNLKNFCHPGINKILKYDEENGTDYYQTLLEYLMGRANMAYVAKKLNIHRNTLYHRINKISEIAEMNLEDGDNYLKLLLSIKIMELYSISSDLTT